ncbi:MAG: hypothetical protein LQ348_007767 [Seirophora lacunosa]|nr:MAG: hypothetical protein LQ344_008075 [Seirophora lacunosa]KAI4166748.1 MAG: hypothetical protein LQ348_007767 [Seirophora lacunosa]
MRLRSNILTVLSPVLMLILSDTAAEKFNNALQYRQNPPVGTGASASASPSNPPIAATSTSSLANETPSASTPVFASPTVDVQSPSVLNDSPSPSATAALPSTSQEDDQERTLPTQGPTPDGVQSTTTSSSSPALTDASEATAAQFGSVSSRTQQYITTVITISGTSTETNVYTRSRLVPASTSFTTQSTEPSLDTSDGGSSKSSLDPSQKRIVIGVVVGIGGAILIGGIVVVAWRIWGRKGRPNDDDNELVDSHPGSADHEKRSSISGQSPFRTTLDQYHNHGGPVNTASNF